MRTGKGRSRLGVTASAKLGGAVVRNRLRRRLRELYRVNEAVIRPGFNIVLVARSRAVKAKFSELEKDFFRIFRKNGLMYEETPAAPDRVLPEKHIAE